MRLLRVPQEFGQRRETIFETMNTPPAKLMVLIGEQFACLKVAGRANFATSVDFKIVLAGLELKGYPYIIIELSDCSLMDSTFLGVLAAFGVRLNPAGANCVNQVIELRNANERLLELLESLGVLHLFKTCQGELPECEEITSAPCNPSREALTRASLEAHQTLMEINPANVSRFKDVTKFLAEDLERIQTKSG